MASSPSIEGFQTPAEPNATNTSTRVEGAARLLVCVPSLPQETLRNFLADLATVFRQDEVLIASPDVEPPESAPTLPLTVFDGMRVRGDWVLTAGDFLAAHDLAEKHDPEHVLLLGVDVCSLRPSAIRRMADELAKGKDLAVPAYSVGPHDGLVASALLYPLTRALFGANIWFPLPMDAGMSRRMCDRMAAVARRHAGSQPDALLWPVAEAVTTGFSAAQVESGALTPTPPGTVDFNALFAAVAGALFADIEVKAPFWQRLRQAPPSTPARQAVDEQADEGEAAAELPVIVEGFRMAYKNLHDLWSLALPPQSLLALKKLSLSEPSDFTMAPALWARIVYDFALAYHLRTLNRGHLMGAFTPLYLAWVASTLRPSIDAASAVAYREETAVAFEREKPYLVSRWRWPDRFNP